MRNNFFGPALWFLVLFFVLTPGRSVLSQEEGADVPAAAETIGEAEMPTDEDIPPEVREEIERALREGRGGDMPEGIMPVPEEGDVGAIPGELLLPQEAAGREKQAPWRPAPQRAEAGVPKSAAQDSKNRISLDLKGVDIIDVLKMFSARSNFNIVAGRNVRGKVTLFLKDVDIWDAFEIILASNDLAYEKRGDIINVMTERDYEQLYGERYSDKKEVKIFKLEYAKAAEVSKTLNQTKSKIGKIVIDEPSNTVIAVDAPQAISEMEGIIEKMDVPVETKIFSLNYAKAEDIKTKIADVLTKGAGAIQVDERTNKVIITDLAKKMPEISEIIAAMDEKHKEVLIEAKIVEIDLTDEFQYGIDWGKFFRNIGNTSIDFNFTDLADVTVGGTTNLGGALRIGRLVHASLDGTMRALAKVGKTNVISSPRITVVNNEEAKVLIGTNQPYVTSTTTIPTGGNPVQSDQVTWQEVGITLRVTPTINNDGFITMKIKPEVSSLGSTAVESAKSSSGATGNKYYPVSKSETDTTVMVKDGTTILIAGLIQDRDVETINKVPILGDIPIISYIFKNQEKGSTGTSNQPEKKEIVIFLTPYIMEGTEVFPEGVNTFYGSKVTQRELLEKQISMAVDDISKRRELAEGRPPKEKVDTNTHLVKQLKWFKEGKNEEKPKPAAETAAKPREGLPAAMPKEEPAPEEKTAGGKGETLIPPTNLITPAMDGYYSYYENIRNKIFWVAKDSYTEVPQDARDKSVKLVFNIASDGRLKGEPEVLNNADERLASAAKEAVKNAAPFPPFPKSIEQPEKAFRITISYE